MIASDYYKIAKENCKNFEEYIDILTEFYIDSITGKRKTEKLFNLYTFIIDGVRYFLNINFRNKNGIYNKEAVNHQTKKAILQIRSGKYSKIIHQKSLI